MMLIVTTIKKGDSTPPTEMAKKRGMGTFG
jgi:hypothetical protein